MDDDALVNELERFAAEFMASGVPAGVFKIEEGLRFGGSFMSCDVHSNLGSLPRTAF